MKHTQRTTPPKRTREQEKVKMGNMNVKHFENVQHENHTIQ